MFIFISSVLLQLLHLTTFLLYCKSYNLVVDFFFSSIIFTSKILKDLAFLKSLFGSTAWIQGGLKLFILAYSLDRVLVETFKDCIQPTQFINNFLLPAVYLIFSFTYRFQEANAFMCFLFLSEPQSLFVILFLKIMQNTVNRSIICGVLY